MKKEPIPDGLIPATATSTDGVTWEKKPAQPCNKLATKLAEVMAVVNRIPKRGRNDFHKYDYATEADIAEGIRQELASRHVILLPAIVGERRDPVGEKGSVLTTLKMEFTFIDGDSGEQITRPWLGAGTDKEDKGAYKAMTGGEKYFLLKTFLVPTGDDPEKDDKPTNGVETKAKELIAPKGYADWIVDMGSTAEEGIDRLRDAWKASKAEFRQFLLSSELGRCAWEEMKARAAKVVVPV